jgi:hypothetical protein
VYKTMSSIASICCNLGFICNVQRVLVFDHTTYLNLTVRVHAKWHRSVPLEELSDSGGSFQVTETNLHTKQTGKAK